MVKLSISTRISFIGHNFEFSTQTFDFGSKHEIIFLTLKGLEN